MPVIKNGQKNISHSLSKSANFEHQILLGKVVQKKRRTLITIGIHVVGMGSWKKREVGKFEINLERMKLESSRRSWKIFDQYCIENFPT